MRGNNEHGRSEAPLCILQGHVSALRQDKNLIADSKQKPFDDISAISVVDAGVSHKVVHVRVCGHVTMWLCMCGYVSKRAFRHDGTLKEHVKHLDLC